MELDFTQWIAVLGVAGTILVGIFSPVLTAIATGRRDKKARTEQRRDEAYTRLMLTLNIERDGIEAVTWYGEEQALVPIPDPEETEWVEARIALVGSKQVRKQLRELRTRMSEFYGEDSQYIRLLTDTRAAGGDPFTDPECLAMGQRLQANAVSLIDEIGRLEARLRSEIN